MKIKALLMAQMALALAAMETERPNQKGPTAKEIADTERETKNRYENNLKKKGVQEFIIDGVKVYARNYKNALRKSKRLK